MFSMASPTKSSLTRSSERFSRADRGIQIGRVSDTLLGPEFAQALTFVSIMPAID
jgi:hypothetical protein